MKVYLSKSFQLRRKFFVRWTTDIIVSLCLDVAFPLLTLNIVINIAKDCWEIRCALGILRQNVASYKGEGESQRDLKVGIIEVAHSRIVEECVVPVIEAMWLGILITVFI